VDFVDCTDRHHPSLGERAPRERHFHIGKYPAKEIPKPPALQWVPRRFKRYGVAPEIVADDMAGLPRPDIILVTSRMTYWYPGVAEAIALCRRVFPGAPIILGGTYATLCPDHARAVCKPDLVFEGEGEWALARLIEKTTGLPLRTPGARGGDKSLLASKENSGLEDVGDSLDALPMPAFDLLRSKSALAIETTRGCPFRCAYCASAALHPRFRRKSPARVADEIQWAVESLGTEDIAFYDDALLLDSARHFEQIAAEILARGLRGRARFHTPNGLFAACITESTARAMREIGVETVRLSLESASAARLREWNRRSGPDDFACAMRHLRAAGFRRDQIGVYILCAMPGQSAEEVRESIDFAIAQGGTPRLAEFSPIPGTPEWNRALAENRRAADPARTPLPQDREAPPWDREAPHSLLSRDCEPPKWDREAPHSRLITHAFDDTRSSLPAKPLPLADEPLLHNNSIYYWASGAMPPDTLNSLKRYATEKAASADGIS